MSSGEVHVGQQEEFPGCSHQRSGGLLTIKHELYLIISYQSIIQILEVDNCGVVLQVVDYYKEACRALENSETASMLGKIQKDWKKLVQMKIYHFAAIAHVSLMGVYESVCSNSMRV